MTWRLIRCLPIYYITSLGCFSEIHPFQYCQIFIKSSTSMHQLTPYPRQHFRTQNGGFLFVNSVLLVLSHYYFLMVSLLRNTLPIICKHSQNKYRDRADSRFAPIKWETALLCNDVSHWLGANLESVLRDLGNAANNFMFVWRLFGLASVSNLEVSRNLVVGHFEWCHTTNWILHEISDNQRNVGETCLIL